MKLLISAIALISTFAFAAESQISDPAFIDVKIGFIELYPNEDSGKAFLSSVQLKHLPKGAKFSLLNKDRSEMITIVRHDGGGSWDFAEYRIEIPKKKSATVVSRVERWVTEKGISLGLSADQIIARLGQPTSDKKSGSQGRTLVYEVTSLDLNVPILKKHNMPQYRGTYELSSDKLTRFSVGFPAP